MYEIYKGRKHHIFSTCEKLQKNVPDRHTKKPKGYLYFVRIGEPQERLFKIGTTNRPIDRMLEHCKYFGKPIYILWFSPILSKYTTLRVEDRQKKVWIDGTNWQYINNDRFIIPNEVKEVSIQIKKNYIIQLE